MKPEDMLALLEREAAPVALSDELCAKYGAYDNSGLILDCKEEVSGALFALDLTESVVNEARERGFNLIVTHHPAIYAPVKSISVGAGSPTAAVAKCMRAGISVISMHLNFDAAPRGIDGYLAEGLGAVAQCAAAAGRPAAAQLTIGRRQTNMFRHTTAITLGLLLCAASTAPAADETKTGVQKLRFVQDDAQDRMVSKIYQLKYVQSNDVTPFLLGIVKRYNMNSSVNCIEYGADNTQLLTVTCPIKMMPYVDDFIRKIDRDIKVDGRTPADVIRGTGITRAVYRPKFRSGQNMLNVLVNSIIGEGPAGSVYAWDANSNQIYWKDNSSNTQYVYEFLSWIDRPAPQITFHFTLYELRESTLRDLGIEYLAWKNGPGLNLFSTAWDAAGVTSGGTAALQAFSGPLGGFLFAPQFDASFIRLLQHFISCIGVMNVVFSRKSPFLANASIVKPPTGFSIALCNWQKAMAPPALS